MTRIAKRLRPRMTGPLVGLTAILPTVLFAGDPVGGSGVGYSGKDPVAMGGVQGIAQREIARRLAMVEDAMDSIARGDKLGNEGDFEGAIAEYRAAVDLLPDSPMTAERRELALGRFADASVQLAKQRADEGRYDDARKLLEGVLAIDEDHAGARKLLSELADPDRYSLAVTPEHVANVQEVENTLKLAVGHYDLAQYDKAREACHAVLRIDRYNSAARAMMEKIDRELMDYYGGARDQLRAEMIRQVDETWEMQVPPSGLGDIVGDAASGVSSQDNGKSFIAAKLNSIIIPKVEFTDASVAEAIEFLRIKSRELDIDPAAEERGVNIIIKQGTAEGIDAPRISLDLANVPLAEALRYITDLAGLKFKVEPFAVVVVPLSDVSEDLYTRVFRVPPDFLSTSGDGGGGGGLDADPFAPDAGGGGSNLEVRATARDVLAERGVTFPEDASAYFNPATAQLIVRNTQSNLDLIESYVLDIGEAVSRQIHIMTKFVEVSQTNTEELGFDWLLGPFDIGTDRVFANGGTAGNAAAGDVQPGEFPITGPAGNAVGNNPVSRGLRFGTDAINNDTIDGLINSNALDSSLSPGIFGLAGVFTDPQFQVVIRALDQKKGVDLMSAPSIVTRSGQRAQIEVIREFIYPTEFDPPEIPQQFGQANIGGTATTQNAAQVSSFPVTPTTPVAFEVRNVGVTLEVDPVIGADGYTIDLNLAPEVVEFEGFINYGSPIRAGAIGADGTLTNIELTPNAINQPIFSARKVTTAVTIWDGQTVAIGGLIREDVQTVEDQVPILGDLPIIGRLFQTKADQTFKRNLMVFVTARLIDPAGQPIRSYDELTGGAGGAPSSGSF